MKIGTNKQVVKFVYGILAYYNPCTKLNLKQRCNHRGGGGGEKDMGARPPPINKNTM